LSINYYVGFISEWLGAIAVAWLLGLSPRLQGPPVGFRYPRREGFVSLSLFGLILVFTIFYYQTINPPVFTDPLLISPAPVHNLGQALILAGLCLLPFLAALVTRKQPPRSAGWDRALLAPGLQMGVALAILTIFLRNRVMDVLGGLSAPVLGALPLALGLSLFEETIFRGYIQMRLGWWLGAWPGLALTAALFSLWHLPAWAGSLPTQTTLILLGLTFVQGLVLGWIMHKSRTVVAPVLYRAISIWVSFIG
jgi:membrane protease YdiL (CAAX protease family)